MRAGQVAPGSLVKRLLLPAVAVAPATRAISPGSSSPDRAPRWQLAHRAPSARGQRVVAQGGSAWRADSVYGPRDGSVSRTDSLYVTKRRAHVFRSTVSCPKPRPARSGARMSCRKPRPPGSDPGCRAEDRGRRDPDPRCPAENPRPEDLDPGCRAENRGPSFRIHGVAQRTEPGRQVGTVSCRKSSPVGRPGTVSCRKSSPAPALRARPRLPHTVRKLDRQKSRVIAEYCEP
jgi:hypothetical protein